jgi:hypothetical protein
MLARGDRSLEAAEARRARNRRDVADCRARQRNGQVLLRPIVDEAGFAVAAVAAGLLDPNVADNVAALTAASKRVLDLFAAGKFLLRGPTDADNVRARLLGGVKRHDERLPGKAGSGNAQAGRGPAARLRKPPAR